MKPSEAAAVIGIAASTIRAWSVGEFKQYLSPTGQGGDGRARNLTEHDIRVLNFINNQKREGVSSDLIHAQLRSMQIEEWDELPPLPTIVSNVASVPMMPIVAADNKIEAERRGWLREIAKLEQQVEKLQERLDAKDERLLEAERKLSAATAELELWRQGRLKRD